MSVRAMGSRCVVHTHREWVPENEHHVWPKGHGGPARDPANLVWLCANAHGAVHHLLDLMLATEDGRVPWEVRRRYGVGVRRVAEAGYRAIESRTVVPVWPGYTTKIS